MIHMLKMLSVLAVLISIVGVLTLGGSLAYGDDDDDDAVTVQFGEFDGVALSPPGIPPFPPPNHHLIEDPGPIDEDTSVVFNMNQSPFGDPALGGIHQVIIYEAGILDTEVPDVFFDEGTEEGLFIYPGAGEFPFLCTFPLE